MNLKKTILALLFIVSSCAGMKEDYLARICHYDGAFEEGLNDAKSEERMAGEDLALQCSEDKRADVRKGYREGYLSFRPATKNEITIIHGSSKPQECHEDNFGKKVCGYNCIKSFGEVHCGRKPDHYCVEDYGKYICGKNCKEDFGKVKCQEY